MAFEKVGVEATVQGFSPYMAKMDQMEGKTSGFGTKLAAVLKRGAVVGVAAAGALGAAALKMGLDFEKSLAEVRTLLPDISDEVFGKMRSDILDMSKEMGIATDKAVPALYQAISAGVPKENVMEFLKTNAKLAIGGVTDLETAVDLTTTAINAFGLEMDDTERVADVLFTGVKLGKTTVEELGASLFQVAPAAAASGVSIEDTTAALATLTASGVPTSVAATQIRQALVEMGKEGTKANEAFQDIAGVGFRQFMEEGGDLGEVMAMLAQKAEEDGVAVSDLFGSIEAGLGVQVLAGEGFDKLTEGIDATTNSAGANNKAFETMSQTASFKLNKAINAVKVTMTDLGSKALPIIVKVVEKLGKYVKVKLLPPLRDFTRRIQDLLRVGGDFVRFLSAVVTGRGGLAALQDRLILIPRPLQELAVGLGRLVEVFGSLITALFDLGRPLADIIGFFIDLAAAVAIDVLEDVVAVGSILLNEVIVPLAEGLVGVVQGFADLTGGLEASKAPMEAVKNILVPLVEAWLAILAARKIVTLTQSFIRTGEAFINFAKLKKNQVQNLTQFVKYTGKKWITNFVGKVQTITQNVIRTAKAGKQWITEFPAKVQTITQNAIRTGAAWITDFAAKTQAITQNAIRTGKAWITDFAAKTQIITQKVKAAIDEKAAKVASTTLGKLVAEGFAKGIFLGLGIAFSAAALKGLGAVLASTATVVGAAVVAALLAAFAIGLGVGWVVDQLFGFRSPELFREIGKLLSGISKAVDTFFTKTLPPFFTKTVPHALGFLVGAFVSFLTEAVPRMIDRGLIQPFTVGLEGLGGTIASLFSEHVLPHIETFFTETVPNFITRTIPEWAEAAARAAAKAFVNVAIWFEGALEGIGKFLTKDAPSEILSGFPSIRKTLQDLVTEKIKIGEWFKDVVIPALGTFFTETMPEAIAGFFTESIPGIAEDAAEIGVSIVEGILDGIGDLAETLFKPFTEGFEKGIDVFKGFLKIESPSQLFAEIGRDIVAGLLEGIEKALEGFVTPFSTAVNAVATWVEGAAGAIMAIGTSLGNLILAGAGAVWDTITTVFSTAVDTIGTWITENAEKVFGFGESVGDALVGGIKNVLDIGKLLWGLVSAGWTWLGSFSQQLFNLGAKVGEAIWDGIKSMIGSLGDLIPFLGKIPGLRAALEAVGIELQQGAWRIPQVMPAILHPGEMVLPRAQAEVVRDTVLAPQPAGIPGLDRLALAFEGRGGGDLVANVTAASQEQIAEEVGRTLRGLAFEMGRVSV